MKRGSPALERPERRSHGGGGPPHYVPAWRASMARQNATAVGAKP